MSTEKIKPIHPGEILLEEFLKPMGLSQNQLANDIGVPPYIKGWEKTFSESQDVLEILADRALEEIKQGKAEEIEWDKL